MKTIGKILAAVLLAVPPAALAQDATPAPAASPAPATVDASTLGYAIGMNMGHSLRQQDIQVDVDRLLKGFRDAYTGGETELTPEQVKDTLMAFQQEMMSKQAAKREEEGKANTAKAVAFLAQNAKKEGVVTLPSGLQYKVLTEGDGPKPKATDTVKVNYKGTLIDGTQFDSSYDRNQPATFQVDKVIPGWVEALQLMPVGSKWELYIPPSLAYGERGTPGGPIPPNAALVFDVELLGIEQPAKPAESPK